MSRKSRGVGTEGVFVSCPCRVGEAPWSLELFGPVCSIEVEGNSTTAAGFLTFGCSADRECSPVVGPCNLVNCSMRHCLSATSRFQVFNARCLRQGFFLKL